MSTRILTPIAIRHQRFRGAAASAHALLATLLALLLASLWGTSGGPALAHGAQAADGREPGGRLSDPVVREADIAAPAVVRIATIYSSHITLNICGSSVTLPRSGAGYSEGVLGSGAFISAHGDILTADHLIAVDHDTLEQQLLADPAAQADIADALNKSTCFGFGPAIAAADIGNGFLQASGIDFKTTFDTPQTMVWRDTWYSGALSGLPDNPSDMLKALMSAPYQQAKTLATSDFTHDDLAVLHIDAQDTPSIRLDSSADVQALDSLTIIGFPGNGDANNNPTNLLTPSFNVASVSAIKTNTDGAELIQVGGNIEHGDSGGPALDAQGRIVGVVSFGGPDNQGITAFLRSSDSARHLAASVKVDMRPGTFESAWERAFADYAATYPGHWRRSSQEFAALLKSYPEFKGAAPYAAWARTQARFERIPQQRRFPLAPIALVALGIAALALAVIVVTLYRAAFRRPIDGQDLASLAFWRRGMTRAYGPRPLVERDGAALLGALDDQLTPASQRLN
ncbi:MAG TPA: trypsin-like peptidase domain-containing protein [Ktedonobacterales bacterium]